MVFSLLLIGGYAAAKGVKGIDNKAKWDKIVANYNLERDFEEILKLCGKGEGNVNWSSTTPEINKTVVNNCIQNLKTIPYLNDKDIRDFKYKCWNTKLKQIEKEKEQTIKIIGKELQEITKNIRNKQTHRTTINIFNTQLRTAEYSKILYNMYKNTIWGEIAYNPKFDEWIKENNTINKNSNFWLNMIMPCGHTHKYEIWVVDEPIGYSAKEIYSKCKKYTKAKYIISEEERDAKITCNTIKKFY